MIAENSHGDEIAATVTAADCDLVEAVMTRLQMDLWTADTLFFQPIDDYRLFEVAGRTLVGRFRSELRTPRVADLTPPAWPSAKPPIRETPASPD
jgi:hypothetical protein